MPRSLVSAVTVSTLVGLTGLAAGCSVERTVGESFPEFESTADAAPACVECEARLVELYGDEASYGVWPSGNTTGGASGSAFRPEEFSGIQTVTGLAFDNFGHLYATGVVDPSSNQGAPGVFLHFDAMYDVVAERQTPEHLWDVTSDGVDVYLAGQRTGVSGSLYASDSVAVAYEYEGADASLSPVIEVEGAAIKSIEADAKQLRWVGWTWGTTSFGPGGGALELGSSNAQVASFDSDMDLVEGEALDLATDAQGRFHQVGWWTSADTGSAQPGTWLRLSSDSGAASAFGTEGDGPGIAVTPARQGFGVAFSPVATSDAGADAPYRYSLYDDQTGAHAGIGGMGWTAPVVTRAATVADAEAGTSYQVVLVEGAVEVWQVDAAALETKRRIRIPQGDIDVFAIAVAPDKSIVLGGRRTSTGTPWIARFTMNGLVPVL